MSKRRMLKPSERDVVCFYCSESMQFKALAKHTIRRHSGQHAREKGTVSLFEFQRHTQKKRRTDEKKSKESGPSSNEQPSIISFIASPVISAVNALGNLITSLRGIVTSLSKSADRLEKLYVEKQSANADKVKRYKSYGEFAKDHQCEGFYICVVRNHHFGRCRICIEHVDQLRKSKSCVFSDTWIHGKKIDNNRIRDWNRHIDSAMHKEARLLKSQPKIGGAFGAAALEAKSLTLNFLRLIYSAFRMSLPYRQIIRLMTTLKECGFDIGNRNHDEKAAAAACDCMYDTLFGKVRRFFSTPNPCTKRDRKFSTSADKGTELQQRQVINFHAYDTDGRLVVIHLTAHIINEIDISDEQAEETTAEALMQHHIEQLNRAGFTIERIEKCWVNSCTDAEPCYVSMGKKIKIKVDGFIPTIDAAHSMESLFDDVEKESTWMSRTLAVIDLAHSRYSGSPKKKRKLRRSASVFKDVYTSLKRIVETRYVKFAVVAGDTLLKMMRSIVFVLEDDWASTKDDGALGLLKTITAPDTIPELMALLDVLDHAVRFSVSSQAGNFTVFHFLARRRSFINKIQIMATEGFNVGVKSSSGVYLSQRLYEHREAIIAKEVCGIKIGDHRLFRASRSRSNAKKSGEAIFHGCLKKQQSFCDVILRNLDRLPEMEVCTAIETCFDPTDLLKVPYDSKKFDRLLRYLAKEFDMEEIIAPVIVGHGQYAKILSNHENQIKYAEYWDANHGKSNSRFKWDPLGVIESFMNPEFSLHEDLHDFCCMLEHVGLIRFTQADTERVVKTQRKVEPRFAGYNEHKETAEKRDRAKQEIFLKENAISLRELPLEDFNQNWLKSHLPSLKETRSGVKDAMGKSTRNFLKNDRTKVKFFSM